MASTTLAALMSSYNLIIILVFNKLYCAKWKSARQNNQNKEKHNWDHSVNTKRLLIIKNKLLLEWRVTNTIMFTFEYKVMVYNGRLFYTFENIKKRLALYNVKQIAVIISKPLIYISLVRYKIFEMIRVSFCFYFSSSEKFVCTDCIQFLFPTGSNVFLQ